MDQWGMGQIDHHFWMGHSDPLTHNEIIAQ